MIHIPTPTFRRRDLMMGAASSLLIAGTPAAVRAQSLPPPAGQQPGNGSAVITVDE